MKQWYNLLGQLYIVDGQVSLPIGTAGLLFFDVGLSSAASMHSILVGWFQIVVTTIILRNFQSGIIGIDVHFEVWSALWDPSVLPYSLTDSTLPLPFLLLSPPLPYRNTFWAKFLMSSLNYHGGLSIFGRRKPFVCNSIQLTRPLYFIILRKKVLSTSNGFFPCPLITTVSAQSVVLMVQDSIDRRDIGPARCLVVRACSTFLVYHIWATIMTFCSTFFLHKYTIKGKKVRLFIVDVSAAKRGLLTLGGRASSWECVKF